jgi:hypothetical protein
LLLICEVALEELVLVIAECLLIARIEAITHDRIGIEVLDVAPFDTGDELVARQ